MTRQSKYFALLCATMFAGNSFASSILLTQSFTGTTASGWTITGNTVLTAASGADSDGSGWLRLTNNSNNQTGFAFNNTAVPSGYGIDATFRYATWGGTGADGFAFILFDGSVTPAQAGAYGGSLGYAQKSGINGLTGGILGIGFDEFGNYSNPTEGRQGGIGFTPNRVVVRGPGDGTASTTNSYGATNYGYLTGSSTLSTQTLQIDAGAKASSRPTSAASYRQAEVYIGTDQFASGSLPVMVKLTTTLGGTAQTVINNFDAYQAVLAFYGGNVSALPSSFKFGFSASTGGSTDYHEIQGLQVNSVQNAPGYEIDPASIPEPGTSILLISGTALLGIGMVFQKQSRNTENAKRKDC